MRTRMRHGLKMVFPSEDELSPPARGPVSGDAASGMVGTPRGEEASSSSAPERVGGRWEWIEPCSPTDPHSVFRDRSIMDQASATFDSDRVGVGSTPWNDPTSSRVMIPSAPAAERYLIRLAARAVPEFGVCRIGGLRQAVGIGSLLQGTVGSPPLPTMYPLEINQQDPFFAFSDGNISWHLRVVWGATMGPNQIRNPAGAQPGTSTDYAYGTDSGLLLPGPPSAGFAMPAAAAGGIPPGKGLGGLGTFRDIRFPWLAQSAMRSLDIEIPGPCVISFWASVKQTNPLTRQLLSSVLPPGFNTQILPIEQQFLLAFEQATAPDPATFPIFRHVSGAIVCEMGQLYRRPGKNLIQGKTPP